MSIILNMLGATPAPTRNPDNERYWSSSAQQSVAGVHVDEHTALKLSTAWACVMLLSETIAMLPLVMYRNLPDGGRERARNHPLYELLHNQPNQVQTAAEYREMMTGHVVLKGNAYSQIVPGPRGAVDQLLPIHPDRIPPQNIEKLPNGRLRYQVIQDDGSTRPFNQEDIFHLRGPSKDGIVGMSVIDYARESIGLGMAAERYGGRFFRNDSRPGGVLKTPNRLTKDVAKRLKASWESAHTANNQHRVAVLEEGLEWQAMGIPPDQAQFLETREFQAEDICRWFRVPPHMVGITSKATSWGTGIEQMSIGFVTYTLLPWLTRWQQSISRDLIIAPQTYFADFIVEMLLRGDINSRYSAYAIGRQWGFLNVDEIRAKENENPLPDGKGQIYLNPMNMNEAGASAATVQSMGLETAVYSNPPNTAVSPHHLYLAEEAAGRIVRKEIAAMQKASKRTDEDREAWATAVLNFFTSDHALFISQTMRIPLENAEQFANTGQQELLTIGVETMTDWRTRRVNELVMMAIGELNER